MGASHSSGREKIKDPQQIQEEVKAFWEQKKSVEDQTVRFLRCVDILESASAHILSCNDKGNGHPDKQFRLDTQARKLLHSSVVIKEEERQSFVKEISKFVELVSDRVSELQTEHDHGNVKCEIQDKYKAAGSITWETRQSEDSEDKANAEDVMKRRIDDLQNTIDQRNDEIKLLKKEKDILRNANKGLEEKDEKYFEDLQFQRTSEKLQILENNKQMKECQGQLAGKTAECDKVRKQLTQNEECMRKLQTEVNEKENKLQTLMKEQKKDKKDIEKSKVDLITKLQEHQKEKDKLYDEKKKVECRLNELETTLDKRQNEEYDVDKKLKQLQEDLKKCLGDKCRIEKELCDENDKCDKLNTTLNVTNEELSKANESNKNMEQELLRINDILKQKQADLDQCCNEKQRVQQDLIKKQNELTKCQNVKKETESSLKMAFENLDKHVQDCRDLESKLLRSNEKYDSCVKIKDAVEAKLKLVNQDLESTRTYLDQVSQDYETTKAQYVLLQKEHQTMELDYRDKVQRLESKVRTHEYNERKLIKDLQTCRSENETLSYEIKKCRSSNEELSDKLNDVKSKRIIKLKLFAVRRPNTLADFEDAVIAMLKSRIDDDKKELAFEQNDNPDVVNTDTDPTIILCFCGSRIGTDAEKAVEGLNLSPKMALVMIHHKDVHALPTQLSERVITGPEYKKLHLITDMAFLRDKGIYPCEINNNSVVKLVNFIKTEGKEYKKY